MNFRQNFLAQLKADLPKITVANGYNNNIGTRIYCGFIEITDNTQLPNTFYFIDAETIEPLTEDNVNYNHKLRFAIGFNFAEKSDFESKGKLTDKYESYISDAKNFLHGGIDACFDYDEVLNRDGKINRFIPDIAVIEPYIDWKQNKGTVLVIAEVEYEESAEVLNVTTPSAPTLTSPANGYATGIAAQSFNWTGTADSWDFKLLLNGTTTILQTDLTVSSFTIPADSLLADGTYTWTARGVNAAGAGAWASAFTLTVGTAAGHQAAVESWKLRIEALGSSVSTATLDALDTFVLAIVSLRSKFIRINLHCGDDITSALCPLYFNTDDTDTVIGGATDSNINFLTSDYTEATGIGAQPNTTKALILNVVPSLESSVSTNDVHISCYVKAITTGGAYVFFGSGGAAGQDLYLGHFSGSYQLRMNAVTSSTLSATFTTGYYAGSRLNSTNQSLYKNGTAIIDNASQASVGSETTMPISEFGFYRADTGAIAFPTPMRSIGYTIGKGLTSAEILTLSNAVNAFQTSLARNVY